MSKSLTFVFWGGILLSISSHAQLTPLYSASEQAKLRAMRQSAEMVQGLAQIRLEAWAKENNYPLRQTLPDGTTILLVGISETGQPIFDATNTNRGAGITTRTDALIEGGELGLNLTGGSPAMKGRLGVWDGGRVLTSHTEFGNRVTQRDQASTTDNHATHVSGTMIASGVNPRARGMATGAELEAYDFGNDGTEMIAAAPDLLVSNHSYEAVGGWRFNSNRPGTDNNLKWEWYGDTTINDQKDYKFGFYDGRAREWDRIAYNAPYYLIVKAAGNSRGSNGPPAGVPYFLGSSSRTSTLPRAAQNDYDLITTYGTAKNILTVGAISVLSNGYNQISDPRISSFSSWGPTDDGRIKPDIVGVGVSVFSTSSSGNNAYASLSGTSMASPNVAGSVFLLQELHKNLRGDFMRSSTLKGLVLHTADDAGNPGPDYQYGWGLLNAKRAAEVIINRDQSNLLSERVLNNNQTQTLQVIASGKGPLVVTISWTDPEAPATALTAANFDNRTPKLINDLDIRVSDGTTEFLPWILNPDQPAANATNGDNFRDNVEQIFIANPVPGRTYTITIRHKATITNNTQPYALIVSGIGGKAYCESRATSDADSKITRVVLGNLTQEARNGCQSYSDFMNRVVSVAASQTLPLEISVGTCGADNGKIVKAFADWNGDGDFDDLNELVATSERLNGTTTFRSQLRAPSGLTVGNITRLRIVMVEATDPNSINSCGTYSKGETQEFLLRFVRPQRDVSMRALVNPMNNFCGNQLNNLTVQIRNMGSETLQNIPVRVQIRDTVGRILGTLSAIVSQALVAFTPTNLTLQGEVLGRLEAGNTYIFECRTDLPNDQDTLNNVLIQRLTVATIPVVTNATATYCDNDPLALITRSTGTAFWYESPTSLRPFAIGNLTSSNLRQPDGTFYVALNDFRGSIGPVTKSAFTGGSYAGNFGPTPLIQTEIPLILESARIYTSSAGRLTFNVLGLDDRFISSTSIDVIASRNPNAPNVGAPSGQVADDPNDPGQVYDLNLSIPQPGTYKITIEYEGGATIFRSNAGVSGFPFEVPGVMKIRGALFTQNNRVDTLTNAYYYFYDLKIKSLGCASNRTPVVAKTSTKSTPTITFEGNGSFCEGANLTLNTQTNGGTYQWFLNNQPIVGATNPTFAASGAGSYTVSTSVNNCLPTLSTPVSLSVRRPEKPTVTLDGIVLRSNVLQNNQWLLDGVPISGATSNTLTAFQTGNYSVRANANGCGEMVSDAVRVVITSVENNTLSQGVRSRVYPNPTSQFVICEYQTPTTTETNVQVGLYDLQGRLLEQQAMQKNGKIFYAKFDLSNFQSGTFFAIIQEESTSTRMTYKIVKP
ncbi:MAG: S8 family serine peptidase [Runella sp.]